MSLSPRQREAREIVAQGRFYPLLVREDDGWHARWRAIDVDNDWVDEYVRAAAMTRLTEDAEDQKHETLHDAWLMALKSRTGLVVWDESECATFAKELEAWGGNASEDVSARQSICFHFAPSANETFSIACDTPQGQRGLKALGQATYVWGALRGLRTVPGESKRLALTLTRGEAEAFLSHGAKDLTDADYRVSGVDILRTVLTVEADVMPATELSKKRDPTVSLVVRVAGEPVTAQEIRFLLDQGSSLVYFRDHWIEVDRNILRQALRALERGIGRMSNVFHFALGLGHIGNMELENVRAHGWLRGLIERLRRAGTLQGLDEIGQLPGFTGTLRTYQRQGVAWMRFLTQNGFGALLADDMGLGKTIQTIAWICASGEKPLIVAPLTLLANWRHEFSQFAPKLKLYVHQGEKRHLASGFTRAVASADVTLTSYTLLVRDYALFSETPWHAIVLDEAQTIKNPTTKTARAVRGLTPPVRVALTGTPVENSVADIWALEDFLNTGLLGEDKAFRERFERPIAIDAHCAAGKRLRHALEPFVLRRLKTDNRIAAELGPKREVKEYCTLSDEQRSAYEAALATYRSSAHTRGDTLALLTELKLICDGTGKLERLETLLEAIFAAGESALVFTQYAKVGIWLQERLAEHFGRKMPFLHGALSAHEREEQIRLFNQTGASHTRANAFILSLRAGGFGLNLIKATHVIHFDRWWNPAVENQASDRAHRIGQTKTVFVHPFITEGTVEEHVDELLTHKASIAGLFVPGEEFLELVKLDE